MHARVADRRQGGTAASVRTTVHEAAKGGEAWQAFSQFLTFPTRWSKELKQREPGDATPCQRRRRVIAGP